MLMLHWEAPTLKILDMVKNATSFTSVNIVWNTYPTSSNQGAKI